MDQITPDLWQEFKVYLQRHRLAESSIYQYVQQAKAFAETSNFSEMPRDELFDAIVAFIANGNKKFAMFAIKHLLIFSGRKVDWRVFYKRIGKEIRQKPRSIQNKALTLEQIIMIRDNLREPYRTILMLQYEGAMRISEVLNLKKQDVRKDDKGRLILSIVLKGGEKATVTIINPETILALRNHYNSTPTDILFDLMLESVNRNYKEVVT